MAVIKKLKKKATGGAKKVVATSKVSARAKLSLPTKKKKPAEELQDFTWMIYGDKKIGKTSLTSRFPKSLIYSFEPGTKALKTFAVDIPDWETALEYSEQLFTTKHNFKNIIIDTGRIAYDRNMEYVCAQLGITHPSDKNDFGKAWSFVAKSFEKFHLNLAGNGLGMVVVVHETIEATELSSGLMKTTIQPHLSPTSLNFYHGIVDIIARYHFIGDERFLTIRGNENIVAGCRMKNNFLTPKGERVVSIPMGESEEEAYANLVKAFNNKQTKTYADIEEKADKKKFKKKVKRNK